MMYTAPQQMNNMRARLMAHLQGPDAGGAPAAAPGAPQVASEGVQMANAGPAPVSMAPQGWNGQMPGRAQMPPSRMPWGGQQPMAPPPMMAPRRPMMQQRPQMPQQHGGYPPGVDPRAAMADPQGYAQWQQAGMAHGQGGPAMGARSMYGGHGQDDRQPPMGAQGGGYGGGYGGMSPQAMGGPMGMQRGAQGGAQGNPYMDMMRRQMMMQQQPGQMMGMGGRAKNQQAMNPLANAL